MLGQVILGKYRVTRLLDEGGMSKIYLARQEHPAREVVVKVLKEALRAQTKAVEHFRREVYIMTRFQHPYAVLAYDADTKDPRGPILVMEYLRGADLNAVLQREGRFTADRAGRLLAQLGDVLHAAHEQGIIHRDLKPGNIMLLHSGTPLEKIKLMDFGLAKMSSMLYISPEEVFDWSIPAAAGTPEYISPEMVRGTELDGRADLYSVGVILYELLTGRRPFNQADIEALMLAHAKEPPPNFASLGIRDVSPAIEAVVMNCLAKHPDQRPSTAWELVELYEKALGRRITQHRSTPGQMTRSYSPAAQPQPPARAALGPAPSTDRHAIRHTVEASMPEVMAMIKLKGFVADLGGEIIESVPGMIRVRLAEGAGNTKQGGMMDWISGTKRPPAALQVARMTDLELHMERRDPAQQNKLTITLVMRPQGGMASVEWKNRCNQISRDLQAYLMGR